MAENVTTTATTSEATVTAQPNVVYRETEPEPGASRYTVVPHPPTPRD
jgi:hypothetical protein